MHARICHSNEACRSLVICALVISHVVHDYPLGALHPMMAVSHGMLYDMHAYPLGALHLIPLGALVSKFDLFCKFDQFNPSIALRRGGRT